MKGPLTEIESIIDSVADQIFAFDGDWRFVYLNARAREQMRSIGKDPAALIGAVLWDEFAEVPNEAALRHVMAEKTTVIDELYYPPLGQWVENHMYPRPGGGVVNFQRYVTERKLAEQALRRSQENLAEAQRLGHTGSGSWNVASGSVFWSDETCRIYGVDPASARPSAELFFSLVHPDDRAALEEEFERVVRARSGYEVEFRVVHGDGAIRHVHSVGRSILDAAGNVQEVVGTVMDVTERRRVEEALALTRAELARVAGIATLGELTAAIAHQMSQPLASIVMNGGAGLRWLAHAPADLGETRTSLERIVREGTRAGEVIQRMRSLALRPSPRTEPFQLNDAIAEMVALMRSELSNQRIALRLELAPALPRVVGDRVQVAQVVLNLLVNAIEAMAELTDRSRELTVTTQLAETGRIVVRVADCGGGIAADVIDRIFDPFVTTKDGAMGLGLSITRTIVERHDGRIWAVTDQRRGATLCFTLATEAAALP